MTNKIENVLVGTRSWLHKSWNGTFYPEGMPEDWQLDFYSQHFKAVLVPQSMWQDWTQESIEDLELLYEPESFYMVFEVSVFEEGLLGQLQHIKSWIVDKAYSVLGMDLSQGEMNFLYTESSNMGYKVTSCAQRAQIMGWTCNSSLGVLSGAPLFLIRLNAQPMNQLKEEIMPFLTSLPQDVLGGCIFAVDDDVLPSHVSDMKMLLELLGY